MAPSLQPILLSFCMVLYHVHCESVNCRSTDCSCNEPGFCELLCNGTDNCKGQNIDLTCYPGYPCEIQCGGVSSCSDATFHDNGATAINVICNGKDACKGANTKLNCGTSDCSLSCDVNTACEDLVASTSAANSWQCTGRCNSVSAPNNFSPNPTTSPTTLPTKLT